MTLHDLYGKRGRMMISRRMARAVAKLNGYFWLPCPICRRDFAGFETFIGGVSITPKGALGVCSRSECKKVGQRAKDEMYRQLERRGLLPIQEQHERG